MRLNRIEIENFKAIGKRQAVDLKPVTLLFGPNSAGKSTILQALHYVREILERQNPDPDRTIAGGPIDLGGFRALVHNHELNRAIRIKLVVDLFEEQSSDNLPINSGTSLSDARFANLDVRYIVGENADLKEYAVVQEVGVGIEVRWSDLLVGPYVSSLEIEMDGESVAAIKSPPQKGRAILTDFNFAHPLLQQIVEEDDPLEQWEVEALGVAEATVTTEYQPFTSPLSEEIWELSRDLAKEAANNWLSSGDKLRTGYRIEKTAFREVPVPSQMSGLFDRGLIQDDSVSEYVKGMAHTNGMESFWASLKRGYKGIYHKMSPKHLQRYVRVFAGRHNVRDLDTLAQLAVLSVGLMGAWLRYKDLIADNGLASGARS